MMTKKFNMAARYQTAMKQASGQGTGNKDIFKFPKPVTYFSAKEGKNSITILPYTIKTANHPLVVSGSANVGDSDYVLNLYVHKYIGPTQANCVCLKQFGKPCPICEQMELLKKQGKEDDAKQLRASKRVFYNIEDANDVGKVKLFESSEFLFEKELIDEASANVQSGGAFVDFCQQSPQMRINFRGAKQARGGFEFIEFKGFSFDKLDHDVSDDLYSQVTSLDEFLKIPTYEEAENMLMGTTNVETKSEVIDNPPVYSAPVRNPQPVVSTGDAPVASQSVTISTGTVPPASTASLAQAASSNCPSKHCFGTDCDAFPECASCSEWSKCLDSKVQ